MLYRLSYSLTRYPTDAIHASNTTPEPLGMTHTATRMILAALFPLSLAAGTTLAFAADPITTPWGQIVPAAAPGTYDFVVTQWPVDRQLVVPAGFPQLVRATAIAGGSPTDVIFEYNADATRIAIVADPTTPDRITVETAEETTQFPDGRIVLTARTAKVNGSRAKLETHPGNHRIGHWSSPQDTVEWTRPLSRWGTYDVRLTYSTASPSGSEIEVTLGDTKLPAKLESTGSWYRYTTIPVGRLTIPAAGDLPVSVRCTKLVGSAVMNLKAVTLVPACEGTPPTQAADGSVTLHGRDATVRGTMLRWEPAEKKQTLGFWTKPTDAAEWTFAVTTPGEFEVEVLQGCGPGQGGSEMAITLDGGTPAEAALGFTVEETGGFQDFKPRSIGRVTIAAAGPHVLRVQPAKIARAAACDIRQIRLVPAR